MQGTEKTILYVDDTPEMRLAFVQAFGARFDVHCVDSGQAALDYLKSHSVASVVTDQCMPHMTGHELLEHCKQLYPAVVRVVVTGHRDLDPILRAVNEGLVARYLIKPWDAQEMAQLLTWALQAHALGVQDSALQARVMETERLTTLGSIAASVIHDLNQPLAYMSSNVQRMQTLARGMPALMQLLEEAGDTLDDERCQALRDLSEELQPIVQDLHAGCNLMQGLTSSVRRLLKPTPADGLRAADPLPVVEYAVSACKEIALRSRSKIVYDGPKHLPNVRMGASELTQVLINVVANAAQALGRKSKPGGKVTLTAVAQGDEVRFDVVDNGPGMSAEVLDKVGTPFFTTRAEGTGLGVTQCRRLVEREGGKFRIESKPNVGTTVTLTVPRA